MLRESLASAEEIGYEFRTNDSGVLQEGILMQSGPTDVKFPVPAINTKIRLHMHHNSLDPVFSGEDVAGMAEFYVVKNDLEADDDEDITSMLITRTGAYALRVKDPQKVWSFHHSIKYGTNSNEQEKNKKLFLDDYYLNVIERARNTCNNSCSDSQYESLLEQYFLDWLNSLDSGLYYYKGTINSSGVYTWTQIN